MLLYLSHFTVYKKERQRDLLNASEQVVAFTKPRRLAQILEARLCAPNELNGALNKALDGLDRVRKCFRFTEPKEGQATVRRYQATNDALAEWLEEYTVACPDASVLQADLHAAYESHCRQSYRRPPSKQMFGRRLQTLRPHIEMA
jgi:phage/plasmid-associated DNA primase